MNHKIKENIKFQCLVNDGFPSHPTNFPWLTLIFGYSESQELVNRFSGSIISPKWILTDALSARQSTEYHLFFGNISYPLNEAEPSMISHKYIEHYEYMYPNFYSNNIGLIELPTELELGGYIRSIDLPSAPVDNEFFFPYLTYYVGHLRVEGTLQERWNNLEVIPDEECANTDRSLMCAGGTYKNMHQGPCTLLLGSPLAYAADEGWKLIGLRNLHYCTSELPAQFTRVGRYLSWIKDYAGV